MKTLIFLTISSLLNLLIVALSQMAESSLSEFQSFPIDVSMYEHIVLIDPAGKLDYKSSSCTTKQLQTQFPDLLVCQDVNSAFNLQHKNSTAFVFASGGVTHFLRAENSANFFENISDITFCSNNSNESASIVCQEGSGIAFWNVNRILLVNMNFSFCGALRNSTSKNFATSSKFEFDKFRVSLFFYNCTNLTLQHVVVQHSLNALGIGLIDTNGLVDIFYSNFFNNTVATNSPFPGGGGFVIEFSYCIPGRVPCGNSTNIQTSHNSDSVYNFTSCKFHFNVARANESVRVLPFNATHEGLGRGGGMGIFFKGNAQRNSIGLFNCEFLHNRAQWGGGLFVAFEDTAVNNEVILEGAKFSNNECFYETKYGTGGGGIKIVSLLHFQFMKGHEPFPESDPSVTGNLVHVEGVFQNNKALSGGGISFVSGHQLNFPITQATQLEIVNCNFSANFGRLGAALYVELFPLFSDGITSSVKVENSVFYNNSINYVHVDATNYSVGIGAVYTSKIPLILNGEIHFVNNIGSAMVLIGTHAHFCDTDVKFIGNKGSIGAGITLQGTSYFVVNDHTRMLFSGNQAEVAGSAIFNKLVSEGILELSIVCFVRHINPYLMPSDWKATFTFLNNGNISIFSSSVYACATDNIRTSSTLMQNILFCQENQWIFQNSSCYNEISTQGDSYLLTNTTAIVAFPGREFILPIKVLDDLKHDITKETGYSADLSSNDSQIAEVDPNYSLSSGNISITGQENVHITIKLQSTGSRPHFIQLPVFLQKCPPGFYFNANEDDEGKKGKCTCHSLFNYRGILNCSDVDFTAQIPWNYWIGVDPLSPNLDKLVMGELANLYAEQLGSERNVITLPKSLEDLDDAICGKMHRTGTLCGKCRKGFAVAVNSYYYECTTCNSDTNLIKNIFLYFVSSYLPYILLFTAIILFRLKLTSSAVNSFLLFAQLTASIDLFDVSIHVTAKLNNQAVEKAYKFLHGLFNLKSFASLMNPFCISRSLNTLDVLCLEYSLAFLPLLVILVTYLVMKFKEIECFCVKKSFTRLRQRLANRRGSSSDKGRPILHAFAAFLLLSYTKVSLVSMKILASTTLYNETGKNVEYNRIFLAGYYSLSDRSFILPYGFIAVLFVTIFVFIPTLFLLGFPQLIDWLLDKPHFKCFRRYWPSLTIHAILDTFQGYYRPKCWFFSGIYLLFRLSIIISYCATNSYLQQYFLQQIFIMIVLSLVAIFKPYKREVFNVVDILMFLNLGIINAISAYFYSTSLTLHGMDKRLPLSMYIVQHILLWLPMIYILCYSVYKIAARSGLHSYLKKKRDEHRNTALQPFFETDNGNTKIDGIENSDSDDQDADSALFRRAICENSYLPPVRSGESPIPTTMVSVLEEPTSGIDTESSGFQTGTNET